MKRFAAAMAALSLGWPAGEAAARAPSADVASYFTAFDQLCLATGGRRDEVLAAAEALGWVPAPQAMVDEAVSPEAPEVHIRLATPIESPDAPLPARLLLSSSPADETGGGRQVHACGVEPAAGEAMDGAALAGLVEARIGLPAFPSPSPLWVFSGDGPYVDEMALLLEENGPYEAARTRPVYMLNMTGRSDAAGLVLLRAGR